MRIIDSHSHYDDHRFDDCRDVIINEILSCGYIDGIVNVGCDIKTSKNSIELAKKYKEFYAVCGIHPSDSQKIKPSDEARVLYELEGLLRNENCVALGEIGLDYHYEDTNRGIQKRWFELQMQLAKRLKKNVVIHDRDAHGDCMDMVRKYPDVIGEFHSFSGSPEMIDELVKRGWYISFSGVITFKNARKTLECVKRVPLDRIMIETDCPYLSPEPYRGKTNRSDYLKYTAKVASDALGLSVDEFTERATENTKRFFKIE